MIVTYHPIMKKKKSFSLFLLKKSGGYTTKPDFVFERCKCHVDNEENVEFALLRLRNKIVLIRQEGRFSH